MLMFRMQFVFDGEVLIDREVRAVESRVADVSPAWPAVVQEFRTIVRRAFETEGKSTGVPWPQLKPSTQSQRRRLGYAPAHPILQRTRELIGSITGEGGGFVEASQNRLAIGSNDPIFWFHQSKNARKSKLPRRAMVLFTGADRTAVARPVLDYAMGRDPNAQRRGRPT
jgi:hypothetical protein